MLSRRVRDFLREDPPKLAEQLAFEDVPRHRSNEAKLLHAWLATVALLQAVLMQAVLMQAVLMQAGLADYRASLQAHVSIRRDCLRATHPNACLSGSR
jgi:hypothetical protein